MKKLLAVSLTIMILGTLGGVLWLTQCYKPI